VAVARFAADVPSNAAPPHGPLPCGKDVHPCLNPKTAPWKERHSLRATTNNWAVGNCRPPAPSQPPALTTGGPRPWPASSSRLSHRSLGFARQKGLTHSNGQPTVGSAFGLFPPPPCSVAPGSTPPGMPPGPGCSPDGDSGCSKLYDPAAGSLSPASGGTPEISNHPASPVAALDVSTPHPATVKRNRQARDPDGRHCRIYVRVTQEERARIEPARPPPG